MKRTSTVLSRKSYVKTNRNELTHETSIIGAKVYGVNKSEKKRIWGKIRETKKAVSQIG